MNCVSSLREHYENLEEQNRKTTMIKLILGGSLVLILGFVLVFFVWRFRRQNAAMRAAMLVALQEGRATFTVTGDHGSAKTIITQAEIEQYFPVALMERDENCVVCLETLSPACQCRQLQCNHVFHAECILRWWVHRPRQVIECPTCKAMQEIHKGASEQPEPATLGRERATSAGEGSTVPEDPAFDHAFTPRFDEKPSPGMRPGFELGTFSENVVCTPTSDGNTPSQCNNFPLTP
jgi:preprotein translocase subunit YajC